MSSSEDIVIVGFEYLLPAKSSELIDRCIGLATEFEVQSWHDFLGAGGFNAIQFPMGEVHDFT